MPARPFVVAWPAAVALCAFFGLVAPATALGQNGGLICCNQLIDVGGDWVTADRSRCIDYMNQSSVARAHLLRGECGPAVDAGEPAVDILFALLLPATAHAQCVSSAGTPVGCGPSIDLTKMSPAPPTPSVCCPEAAALCDENSCKEDPPREGFVFVAAKRPPQLRSEPSESASVVATPPNGMRVVYHEAVRVGGQTWFLVEPPGGRKGWLSGEDAGCKRPTALPPRKPVNVKPSGHPFANTSAAQAGSRG